MSDTDNPKKKLEENEGLGEEKPPRILQEMDKRLQNLEQGQSEMRQTLQRLWRLAEEQLEGEQPSDENPFREVMYDWVDEEERKKLKSLEDYLGRCISSGLDIFCWKHSWLLQDLMSEKEGNFYGDLFALGVRNAQFYLGKKSREDLDPIYKYDEYFYFFMTFRKEAFKKIVEERGLNSEQRQKVGELAYARAYSLRDYLMTKEKTKGVLYRGSRDYKAFWMEAELSNFIKIMKEGVAQHIKDWRLIDKIPEAFMKDDGVKKYEGRDGEKKFKKDIADEVFAEFEKDLRGVQRDVMKYWESAKHWWEKWWVMGSLAVGGLLSVFASNIAICKWFVEVKWFGGCGVSDWGLWFLPSVVAVLAAGYFVYLIYKRIKNRW